MKRQDACFLPQDESLDVNHQGNIILILDQTLESNYLLRKFRYMTTGLQLFLQSVPVFKWFPWDVFNDIEPHIFNAVMRIGYHEFNSKELLHEVLKLFTELDETIFNPYEKVNMLKDLTLISNDQYQTKQRLADLLKNLLNDKLYMLEAVRFPGAFKFASDNLRDDLEVVLQAVKGDGYSIKYASERFQHDEMVVLEAVKSNNYVIEYISTQFRDNERIVLEAVKNNRFAIQYASPRLKNDEKFALKVIQESNECALEFLADKFRDNEEIVMEAVKKNSYAIQFASDRLKDNREIAIEAVRKCGWVKVGSKENSCWFSLASLSERLKMDKEIELMAVTTFVKQNLQRNQKILEATKKECMNNVLKEILQDHSFIKENTSFFQFTSDLVKDNAELVLELVRKRGELIEFASERLKDNYEIAKQAVRTECYSLHYVSDRLKNDKQLVKQAIKQSKHAFSYAKGLQYDIEFIMEIFIEMGFLLENSFCDYVDDETILLEAFKNNCFSIQYASDRLLRLHGELVLEILSNNLLTLPTHFLLRFFKESENGDEREILEKAIENNSNLVRHLSHEFLDNKEIVLKPLEMNGNLLRYVSDRLKDDRETVLTAVASDGLALKYVSGRLKDDREIVLKALKNSSSAFQFAGASLRSIDAICYLVAHLGLIKLPGFQCKEKRNKR